MATIIQEDFEIYKGFTFSRDFSYTTDDGQTVDLTGYVITFHYVLGAAELLMLATDGSPSANGSKVRFVDITIGTYSLLLTDEDTNDFQVGSKGRFYFALKGPSEIEDVDGRRDPIRRGIVNTRLVEKF